MQINWIYVTVELIFDTNTWDQFNKTFKPHANGRNFVGQQLRTLLHVTCCVRLHTLLYVVGSCCAKSETSKTFEATTPNISFVS